MKTPKNTVIQRCHLRMKRTPLIMRIDRKIRQSRLSGPAWDHASTSLVADCRTSAPAAKCRGV
jgi:hypothetical protein